jgi:hypothetical protein
MFSLRSEPNAIRVEAVFRLATYQQVEQERQDDRKEDRRSNGDENPEVAAADRDVAGKWTDSKSSDQVDDTADDQQAKTKKQNQLAGRLHSEECISGILQSEMLVGAWRGDAAPRRPLDKTLPQ